MKQEWTLHASEEIFSSEWVRLRRDSVTLSNGSRIDDFYVVTVKDAAAIVALDSEGNLILKSEYRYCCGQELIEIPAGGFEPEESDPLSVAQRELLEETGFVSDEWQYLGATVEDPSKLTNRMHLFFANNCRRVSGQSLDETEVVDLLRIPLEKAVEMVMQNEICCNSSAHGILRVARMLGK